MAYCLHLYFKISKMGWGVNHSGLISPPTERLELRRIRQYIGEDFLTWANEFYGVLEDNRTDPNNTNINTEIPRSEIYNNFLEKNRVQSKWMTPQKFKKKMLSWCQFVELQFNPQCADVFGNTGKDDKRGGIEYFTVAKQDYSEAKF